ncbi:MAG: SLC13 family permease, partial [Candidatus Eremiobacteraeota bacterium]|nr:SLC13 family permease [Candidatus Eremiobacteraeota bacterium]
MTVEIFFTLVMAAATVVLFVTEKFRVDVVAALTMTAFLVSGIITPEQGISGFSNPATVTVAAMFILSAGLYRTGALDNLAALIARAGGSSPWLTALSLMLVVGVISAFINNTAAVAIFLPVTFDLARRCKISPSKLLIPLSFASLFGGACTLVGTSTNVLVSSIAKNHGLQPFGMFEMAPLGLLLAAFGIAYMLTIGMPLLPSTREPENLEGEFELAPYLCEIVVAADSQSCGHPLATAPLIQEQDLDVLEVRRQGQNFWNPSGDFVLQAADVLRVRCAVHDLMASAQHHGVSFRAEGPGSVEERAFVEAVVGPGSPLIGHSLSSYRFRERFPASAIALRRSDTIRHSRLAATRLRVGDVLLLATKQEAVDRLRNDPAFVLVSEVNHQEDRRRLMLPALAIMVLVVALAALDLLPIVVSSILGCALMLLIGCLKPDEAYAAIDWKVIVLLGGMLTLGTAMEETGAARLLAES